MKTESGSFRYSILKGKPTPHSYAFKNEADERRITARFSCTDLQKLKLEKKSNRFIGHLIELLAKHSNEKPVMMSQGLVFQHFFQMIMCAKISLWSGNSREEAEGEGGGATCQGRDGKAEVAGLGGPEAQRLGKKEAQI